MARYPNRQYVDMFLGLGVCDSNATAAKRLYAERFPYRRHPVPSIIRRVE